MAETTITGLPNATTPLSGAERVAMDQGLDTVDATTADIAATLPEATTSAPGKMSAADKVKLNGITGTNTGDQAITSTSDATSHTVALSASGSSLQLVEGANITLTTTGTSGAGVVTIAATGGGATNLSYTAATRVLASDTGTDATLPLVTTGNAGLAPASGGGTANFLRADGTWAQTEWDVLLGSAISITGTATATLGRMHLCSGTAADYTVTLPTAVGQTGKVIGFRMDAALTRFVTLDGNASETLDGATTRIMWSGEMAILRSDGSNWHKIGGLSKPLEAQISRRSGDGAQSINHSTVTTVLLVRSVLDNSGRMQDLANNAIACRRGGAYLASGTLTWGPMPNANATQLQGRVTINTVFDSYLGGAIIGSAANASVLANGGVMPISLAYGDSVTLAAYQLQNTTTVAVPLFLGGTSDGPCNLRLVEYAPW